MRVVEVIPGKTTVGIEIPNEDRQIVRFSEVLESPEYDDFKSPVTIALGHDIGGRPVIADLARMPPAGGRYYRFGQIGGGECDDPVDSVQVHARRSAVDHDRPENARTVDIRRYSAPALSGRYRHEGSRQCLALERGRVERRYRLMSAMGVRNLAGFNRKVKDAIEAGTPLVDPLSSGKNMEDEAPLLKSCRLLW